MVRPFEQFLAKRPSLNLFGPYMRVDCLDMTCLVLLLPRDAALPQVRIQARPLVLVHVSKEGAEVRAF
jgi:hypothetical protein